jgi:hypothetical protein
MDWEQHMKQLHETREADAKRLGDSDRDLCMVCGAYGADKRSLIVEMGYQLKEISDRFIDLHLVEGRLNQRGFYLLICKVCRGELIGKMREWYEERKDLGQRVALDHDGYADDWDEERPIAVRVDGRAVMMSEEEYAEYERQQADKEPT